MRRALHGPDAADGRFAAAADRGHTDFHRDGRSAAAADRGHNWLLLDGRAARRGRVLLLVLAALCALMMGALPGLAAGVADIPPPDDTGSFVGTWYYVDPGFRIAIFVSEDSPGVFKVRYHVRDKKNNEYETDTLGKAKYVDEDSLVQIIFTAKVEGPNTITGRHERLLQEKSGAKIKESGNFEMYRAEFGRKLVLRYPEWKSEHYSKTGRLLSTNLQSDVTRLFRRASTIVVDFDEIKF
jgi:hypothetical protein